MSMLESQRGLSESLFPVLLASVVLMSTLTSILVAARLITKRLVSAYGVDDYHLIAAWAVGVTYNIILVIAGLKGLGKHLAWILQTESYVIPGMLLYSWIAEVLYTPAIWLAKAALVFQLIQIFTPHKSGAVYLAFQILLWCNFWFYIATFFVAIFQCHPIRDAWNPNYDGHCLDRNTILVVSAGINVFSDLVNLLLPLWAIWHLQMPLKRKYGVTALFATGVLAFVFSICRLVFATRITPNADVSHVVAQHGLWAGAEITSVIICTCLPMIPRFVALLSERYRKIKSRSAASLSWKQRFGTIKSPPALHQKNRYLGLDEDEVELNRYPQGSGDDIRNVNHGDHRDPELAW